MYCDERKWSSGKTKEDYLKFADTDGILAIVVLKMERDVLVVRRGRVR